MPVAAFAMCVKLRSVHGKDGKEATSMKIRQLPPGVKQLL